MSQSNLTNFFEKLGPISSRTSPEKKNSIKDIVELPVEDFVEEIPAQASEEPVAKKKRKRNRKKGKQPEESSVSLVITVDDSSRSSTDSNLLPEKTSPKGTANTEQKTDPPKIDKSTKPKPTVQKQLTGAAKEKEEHQPKAKRTGSTTKDPSEKEWVIEAILKHRFVETTKIEYFIKWKDWPSSTNTWEPLEHMVNCQKMIDDYHENHRQECVEHNKHFPSRPNEVGFGRGLKPEKILGFCDDFADFAMLIKWKSPGSNTFMDVVSADEVYEKAPGFMCEFIESIFTDQLIPDKGEDNEEDEEDEDEEEKLDSNDNKDKNRDENGECSEDRFGDVMEVDVLKDPMILGNVVENRKNYFIMKERKSADESQYLVPTKTAYKHFRKAVFRYFERNLVRTG